MNSKRKQIRNQNIIQLLLLILIIILLNYIGSFIFKRIDLTSEKRYTLSDHTVNFLKNLDDIIYVQIYLDGKLPSGFMQMRNSIKEMLDEFRIYAKDNIEYEFINPSASSDKKIRNNIYKDLYKKGLNPTNLQEKDDEGKVSEKIIWPGIIVTYRSKETAVNLLKNNPAFTPQQNLNNSIQDLEFELLNVMKKLTKTNYQNIAFITGHGELDENETADITNSLSETYHVNRIKINHQLNALNEYDLIIIAQPDSAFDEKDKFIIDQFIMRGGKSIWLIDPVAANMDSLAYIDFTVAMIKNLNLDDQLFQYGIRINPNLIEDIQCALIPINTSVTGGQPKFAPAPWMFFPLLFPPPTHSITRNLNMIKAEFASVIDTVGENNEIKKTTLLYTSKFTKVVNAPVRIDLKIINEKPEQKQFTKSFMPVAVLLEGIFTSSFQFRIPPEISESKEIGFIEKSKPTKMVVISDGDIIRNQIRWIGKKAYPYPLGFDRYTQQMYGNKDFILNVVNYLCDESGIMQLRSRELKLRLLDRVKIDEEAFKWKTFNTLLPILFVLFFGFVFNYFRKKYYTN